MTVVAPVTVNCLKCHSSMPDEDACKSSPYSERKGKATNAGEIPEENIMTKRSQKIVVHKCKHMVIEVQMTMFNACLAKSLEHQLKITFFLRNLQKWSNF